MALEMPKVEDLLQAARADGSLSAASLSALTIHADLAGQVQAGLGLTPDDVPAAEVLLVTQLVDDSGSIRFARNADAVRSGHNLVLDSLAGSAQRDEVLAHTRYLNGRVLFPFRRLDDAIRLDSHNYDPNLGTPLYDQMAVTLGTVIAKAREFQDAGVPVRTLTLVVTDGGDQHSLRQTPQSVRALVEDLLREETHVVAAMGIDDGHTDFRAVFAAVGIPDAWILTPGSAPSDVRRAFQVVSRSAVRVSQGAGAFTRAALGGFGA